jgi:hypothetical protein
MHSQLGSHPFDGPPNSYSLRICSNSSTFALRSIPSLPPYRQDARLCGGGPNQSIEVGQFRVSKSKEFPLEISLNYIASEGGCPVVCFVTDISERLAFERRPGKSTSSTRWVPSRRLSCTTSIMQSRLSLHELILSELPCSRESSSTCEDETATNLRSMIHRHGGPQFH